MSKARVVRRRTGSASRVAPVNPGTARMEGETGPAYHRRLLTSGAEVITRVLAEHTFKSGRHDDVVVMVDEPEPGKVRFVLTPRENAVSLMSAVPEVGESIAESLRAAPPEGKVTALVHAGGHIAVVAIPAPG